VLETPARRGTVLGMTILKQAVFSIAFALMAVAIGQYVMWILEQNGWIKP
jgi:hypothetical protein